MNRKKVSLSELYPIISELIEANGKVSFTVVGISMQPMLYNKRDTVTLIKPEFPLKKYDLPLYRLDDGRFILHRVVKVNKDFTYDCRGDNCWETEKSVRSDQIIGVVKSFTRKNKTYETDSSVGYFLYVRFWPALHYFKKYYHYIPDIKKKILFLKNRLFPIKNKFISEDGTVKNICFRPAAKSEIKGILYLAKKHGDFEIESFGNYVLNQNWITSESAEKYFITLAEKHFLWVAADSERLVAYAAGSVSDKEVNNFTIGKLSYIYVDEDYRSYGIGSRLVELFKEYCREKNCTNLSVSFLSQNAEARKFYEKQGFTAFTETYMSNID